VNSDSFPAAKNGVFLEDEDEDEDEDDEEEYSESENDDAFQFPPDMKGSFIPNCCQNQSCGSCDETKANHAPSKTNYALSKNALLMDLRNEGVSLR
jgi:hypothetical protein